MDNPFQTILSQLEEVKRLVQTPPPPLAVAVSDPPLNVDQAAQLLGISTSTLYKRIDQLPHRKQFGRLYFFGSELEAYLRNSPCEGKPA